MSGPRMTCPECEGKGHHPYKTHDVGHTEDDCPDPAMHDSAGGYDSPEHHYHHAECIRCGRAGTITPPEVLLAQVLAALAIPAKRKRAKASP